MYFTLISQIFSKNLLIVLLEFAKNSKKCIAGFWKEGYFFQKIKKNK